MPKEKDRPRFKKIIGEKKEEYDPMKGDGFAIDIAFILKNELEKEKRKRRIKLIPKKSE